MAPYRVLVVDDSAFMRKIISDLILQDGQFEITATAADGLEAVTAAADMKPDVITMDLEMPKMNGIEALQLIMKARPVPIIMLSGISEDNTRDTIKALQFGAFDFIRKPSIGTSGDDILQVGEQLLEKLRAAVYAKRSSGVLLAESPKSPIAPEPPKLPSQTEPFKKPLRSSTIEPISGSGNAATPQKPLHNPAAGLKDKENKKSGSSILEKPKISLPKTEKPGPLKPERAEAPKPSANKTDTKLTKALPKNELNSRADKIKESSPVKPPEVKPVPAAKPSAPKNRMESKPSAFKHVVAIGTSTGGPRALHEVVCSLPANFPAPVLIVQHMPPRFTKSLAQRLDSFSELTVVEAEQGMRVAVGHAYIAPGGYHMELIKDGAGFAIRLTEAPQRNGHRPSVDVMFESLLGFRELERHAVIMTGMGSDGAKGMKALADNGAATTIAESEDTCIVYGMPRSAVESGAARTVLPLHNIASKLVSAVSMP
ncbi:chemotaxis protein CheB [Paenibacillus soyae]|uniref:Protein-glutamate methylesterase/protein-glutamine glutaminase n=1 Tax=Paenibacillus soyae TaxID=2969249 RepID=A0A9X2MQK1_9BACL|nr:chemotaxis protein CheB [Paenibacillus soyae]MCR2805031.1 response regulator [Paenibacillus soyae]